MTLPRHRTATVAAALVTATACLTLGAVSTPAADAASGRAHEYANCTDLNSHYPHGVGRPGAVDHTSGTPVRSFYKSTALYNANAKSDRDKDGIACEKA